MYIHMNHTVISKSCEFVCNVMSFNPGEPCSGTGCTCAKSGIVNSRLKSQLSEDLARLEAKDSSVDYETLTFVLVGSLCSELTRFC